jgi:hypothetical protein
MDLSPFDPTDRLEPGERRFTIREHDRAGPGAITEWCRIRRNIAFKLYGTAPTGEAERGLKAELAQCAEAETLALDWKEKQDSGEIAEAGVRAAYSEVVLTEAQVAKAERQREISEALRHLREAAYRLSNAIEANPLTATVEMAMGLENINATADAIEEGGS